MISGRSIRKKFGELEILKGVDIDVSQGEIVSIVGASGAGKTTLLTILGTLDRPDQGSIVIKGEDVSRLRDRKLSEFRNRHIGFVFQFHQLLPEFTAVENVMMPALIAGKPKKTSAHRAADLLVRLGLQDRAQHKPSELSGGEQQRVAVARALMNEPAVIFADEPSGNLDSKNADDLHRLFISLRDELKQTFVIVTHNRALAELADRTLTMKDGLIVSSQGAPV
jgi:lipoprotein-releasing system ATP-binding protein